MILAVGLFAMALPAPADTAKEAFVSANLIGVFYHEMGHALIELLGLPVFGQEEDAADVASVILITSIFDDETILDMAYDTSLGYLGEVTLAEEDGEIAWWGVHGPDEQRFYNNVCLFYGSDPDMQSDFAEDMGLPEDRADSCPEEYDLAADSWGAVLDDISGSGDSLRLGRAPDGWDANLTTRLIAIEVADLNSRLILPEALTVNVEPCGETNAWFDPEAREIVMCTEFAPHLEALFDLVNADP